jgi:hypothetical protein
VHGPSILIEALSRATILDKFNNVWQYHSRSDRHSKIACWGIAFDLLATSRLLQRHAAEGQVVLGVNHKMVDYSTGRNKKLDLVIARPEGQPKTTSLASLAKKYDIRLTVEQRKAFDALPSLYEAPVGAVQVALEAKAAMTAHIKALPRLYDELNSSHLCVHGASRRALAIGFVMINAAPLFVSSDMNKFDLSARPAVVSEHAQPHWLQRTIGKVAEIPRRSSNRDNGFDGIGIVVVNGVNDGQPYTLVTAPPAPQPGESFHYDSMITRMANEYDTTFSSI